MLTRIVLIRHGEGQSYRDGIVGGHDGCRGLSLLGRRQVQALATRIQASRETQGSVLVSSGLRRAEETAEILSPVFSTGDFERSCDLCERHPGKGDGLPVDEFNARYPEADRNLYTAGVPEAESWATFAERGTRALKALATKHAGATVVAATHGGVIATSFMAFGQQPVEPRFDLHIDHASITEWLCETELPHVRWKLVRMNDPSHAQDLGSNCR